MPAVSGKAVSTKPSASSTATKKSNVTGNTGKMGSGTGPGNTNKGGGASPKGPGASQAAAKANASSNKNASPLKSNTGSGAIGSKGGGASTQKPGAGSKVAMGGPGAVTNTALGFNKARNELNRPSIPSGSGKNTPQQSPQKPQSIQGLINASSLADQGLYGRFSTDPNWQTAPGASDFSSNDARKAISPGGWMGMTKNADGSFSSSFTNKYGNPVVNWSGSFAANPNFRTLRSAGEDRLVGRGLNEQGNKLYRALEDTSLRLNQPITVFSAGRPSGGMNHKYGNAIDNFLRDPVTNVPVGEGALAAKGPGLARWASFPIGGVNPRGGRPPKVAAAINSVLAQPYKQWSNAVFDTVYQNPDAYSGVQDNLRYGGDFQSGTTARDYMHHDVTPGKGLQVANHNNAATRAVAGSFVSGSDFGRDGLGASGLAAVTAPPAPPAPPVTQVAQAYVPRPNPRPPVQTVQGYGSVMPGPMPTQGAPQVMAGITPGPISPVSTPPKQIVDRAAPSKVFTTDRVPQGTVMAGPMPPQGVPQVMAGITPGPVSPFSNPAKQITDRFTQTPGPVFSGVGPKLFNDRVPQGTVMAGPMTPTMPRGTVMAGPMPPSGIPNAPQVASNDSVIEQGDTTTPGLPFRNFASESLPPGYRTPYGIGRGPTNMPQPGESQVASNEAPPQFTYSDNPVQGSTNPAQEPEDPRVVKERRDKYANTGAAIGGIVAGPLGAVIGGFLGDQMGKTSPQLRQQIAQNPEAVRQNVASINQMVSQHMPDQSKQGGSMYVTEEGFKDVMAQPEKVISAPEKYTTLEQMLAALAKGVNPYTGATI